ncbi:MAG: glycoside hydrolase family 43 protein [Archaeoglobaceae archaeon]
MILVIIAMVIIGASEITIVFGNTFFENPVLYSESPDPWVLYCEEDGYYYLMVTTGDGVWVRRSKELHNMKYAEKILLWCGIGDSEIKSNVWAPELHKIDGKWYIYACGCLREKYEEHSMRLFVLESQTESPLGPYEYRGILIPDVPAIDPTVWQDPVTKKLYIAWSQFDTEGQCIYIAPMESPIKVGYPRVKISKPEYDWEKRGAPINEGPQFLYNSEKGKLFLVYSASGTWTPDYCLGMLVFKGGNLLDPNNWEKMPEPVFKRADQNKVWGPGHCSFVKTPSGEHWLVYHAKSTTSYTMRDRSTRIQPFLWNEEGFPIFGEPLPLTMKLPCPK